MSEYLKVVLILLICVVLHQFHVVMFVVYSVAHVVMFVVTLHTLFPLLLTQLLSE